MAIVQPDGSLRKEDLPRWEDWTGKKVMVLMHGFNNPKEEVLPVYQEIVRQLNLQMKATQERLYDGVLGYFWPGRDRAWEYFAARQETTQLAQRVSAWIHRLAKTAQSVDVMAHSMGNRLLFEALRLPAPHPKPIRHLFSLAAAVDDETIGKKQLYAEAIAKCQEAYIFYSKSDEVLQLAYAFAEGDEALGYDGPSDLSQLPKHVQAVDCTQIVATHGAYYTSPQIYTFIREKWSRIPPMPERVKQVRLLNDGTVEVMPASEKQSAYFSLCALVSFLAQHVFRYIESL